MNGYIILTLALAFFVTVKCGDSKRHIPHGPVYDGLNAIIDDAIRQSDMISADVAHRMNLTLNYIKDKADQLKDNNMFTRKIESLKTEGEDVQKCLKQHELATAQFMRKLVNTFDTCSKDLKQEVNDAVEKISAQTSVINGASKRLEEIKTECMSQEETNAGASVLYAVTHIAQVKEDVFEAIKVVEMFIRHGVENIDTYASNNCDGMTDVRKEFDSLSAKIDKCVQSK